MNTIKKNLIPFNYKMISLNPLNVDDLHETLIWRNTYKEWFNDDQQITLDSHLKWYEYYLKKDNDFIFIVRDNLNNKVGQASVYNINWSEKKGEFGRFLVNPMFAGQSYMKLACQGMVKLCYELLMLELIYLEVKPANQKAIHIYESANFKIEKILENKNLFMRLILSNY